MDTGGNELTPIHFTTAGATEGDLATRFPVELENAKPDGTAVTTGPGPWEREDGLEDPAALRAGGTGQASTEDGSPDCYVEVDVDGDGD